MIGDDNLNHKLPLKGFGTYKIIKQDDMDLAIEAAYKAGYRLIDSAMLYKNERLIGNSFKKLNIPRKEVILTTKIDKKSMSYKKAKEAVRKSLENFQTDYIDLVLIHWPLPRSVEVWRALEELCESGVIRYIGVSNFKEEHLRILLDGCKIRPTVNQIELHPMHYDKDLVEYCNKENIQIQAYTPLATMHHMLIDHENIKQISFKYNKTAAQVILKWGIQHNWCVLPKSIDKDRIRENYQLEDFYLTDEEMNKIDNLGYCLKIINNPKCNHFN